MSEAWARPKSRTTPNPKRDGPAYQTSPRRGAQVVDVRGSEARQLALDSTAAYLEVSYVLLAQALSVIANAPLPARLCIYARRPSTGQRAGAPVSTRSP